MISVVKSDREVVTNSNTIEENRGEARFSGDVADSPDEEKARVSGLERDFKAPESEAIARVLENNGSTEELKALARLELMRRERFNSFMSEFDDFVANEKHEAMAGASRALSYGFEVGDMVWGKVKSHPWWPGHIFNEAFASSSVRRTRREGYVLVAFFGDSSYGWFDPAELIPFDPYFAEKSQQTNSRNFVKAVEEAVDEMSRRRGLGLACRCRNKYNFRPTNVQGYFEVDVPDYEPRGVYSANQIKKARDGFQPSETIAFVKQLALGPQGCDQSTIDFVKNKATVFAFRKSMFEEFDETYAQAFGVQPKLPVNDPASLSDQPVKYPTRAPLSGPLVIAEALGGGKSHKKPMKVKDHSKKDRYLFKRRDEPVDSVTLQLGQRQASSSAPAACEESSSAIVTGDFVLQKRAPTSISAKHEHAGIISKEVAGPSEVFGKEAVSLDHGQRYLGVQTTQGIILDEKSSPGKEKDALQETNDKMGQIWLLIPQQEGHAIVDFRYEENSKVSRMNEDSPQTESFSERTEGDVKKAKVLKRPLGDLSSENSIIKEKKKKKKLGPETSPDRPKKRLAMGTGGALVGKSSLISASTREDPQEQSDYNAVLFAIPVLFLPESLVSSPPSESEPIEIRATKSPSTVGVSDSSAENVRDLSTSKPVKSIARPDDPTRVGRKRLPSDRQEEIVARRLKKISQLKTLAAEKKAGQRTSETQRSEGKELATAAPPKPAKSESSKKIEPHHRAVEPTMLVMKFPPGTSLPSVAELKARFARFGSIDQSAIRVFWQSSTCRVVFRHKLDAQAAYKYAVGNNSLFGNDVNVRYTVREVGAPAPEAPESDKGREDDTSVEAPRLKDPANERLLMHQPLPQSTMQLKSILKKPTGDEAGQVTGGNGGRGTARVKFMLGGEETSRESN
ncbi:hypothetical protein GH714_025857 [Hevea brasiliensis]|uniref:PWWP domain-containing protein n=1 Tax=Hevea brasiliensis TaxID=3981 RepID=A0A6A6M5L7_HEVBR|nr:hypothetical protein GH714_025857 [Hevea brasiliensis]